jgi:CRP/FNR family transcriptional regulator, cyclic AMP receptor protein
MTTTATIARAQRSRVEQAGLLARAALAVAAERMGGRPPEPYLEGEEALRSQIVEEVRRRLKISPDDVSDEAFKAIEDALDAEMEAAAEPPVEAALARLGWHAAAAEPAMPREAVIDKRSLLSGHELFAQLSTEERDRLVNYMRIARHPAGAVLFRKGDPGSSMMVVRSGRVKVCTHSEDGKELVLNLFNPGDVFGEIAMLDGSARTADAVTLEPCELLVLERRDFVPFLARHPEACMRLLAELCRKLRNTSELLEEALFLEGPARLAKLLAHLAETFGKRTARGVRIELRLSQQQLSNLFGMSLESMNEQLGLWRRDGLVALEDGHITILDLDRLREL